MLSTALSSGEISLKAWGKPSNFEPGPLPSLYHCPFPSASRSAPTPPTLSCCSQQSPTTCSDSSSRNCHSPAHGHQPAPCTRAVLCKPCPLPCWQVLLSRTTTSGVFLPWGMPKKEENKGKKHALVQQKDTSSKRGAPHAVWPWGSAPGKATFKPRASSCQFGPPVHLQVHPPSSWLSSPVPEGQGLAGGPSSSAQPCQRIPRVLCPC